MSFIDKTAEWNKTDADAKQYVCDEYDKSLNFEKQETSNHMQDHFDEYYDLVKLVLECDQNPYGWLQDGSYMDTWVAVASLINSLHHSCIDDGAHSFVSCDTFGPKLMLLDPSDFYDPENELHGEEKIYYEHAHPGRREQEAEFEEMWERIYEKRGKPRPRKKEGRTWCVHTDYKRFIKELTERPALVEKRWAEFSAKRSKVLGK